MRPLLATQARRARVRALGCALALAAFLAAPAAALAQAQEGGRGEGDPESLPIPEGSPGPAGISDGAGGTLLRLLLGLVVVLGLIAAVRYVLRRVQRSRYAGAEEHGSALIEIVATTRLGPDRALHLVRVGEGAVLVGAAEGSVRAVARLSAADLAGLGVPPRSGAVPPAPGGAGVDGRARPLAGSGDHGLIERLRALTLRR